MYKLILYLNFRISPIKYRFNSRLLFEVKTMEVTLSACDRPQAGEAEIFITHVHKHALCYNLIGAFPINTMKLIPVMDRPGPPDKVGGGSFYGGCHSAFVFPLPLPREIPHTKQQSAPL